MSAAVAVRPPPVPELPELPEPSVAYDVRANVWRMREAYFYEEADFGFVVPPGFPFDLASIPRLAWFIAGPHELSIAAAGLHDYLYRRGGKPKWIRAGGRQEVTRKKADLIFREEMQRRGVPTWRREGAYRTVRLLGWRSWRRAA